MKKFLPFLAVIVAIAAVIGIAAANKDDNKNTSNPAPTSLTSSNESMGNMNNNSPPPSSESSSSNKVTIANFSFSPANITVKKGTTVTWTNNDSVSHTVTADSGNGPDSELLSNGQSYSFTFNDVGTFSYHCTPHPDMHGKVTVTE